MSFEIDNKLWKPQTTTEHANKIMEQINVYLQQNEVKDSNGNIVQLTANFANALYLLCLSSGSRIAENDEKLNRAINSFNIELCDDQQIEHLLPIAAIERNQGSYSTLLLTCKASEDGECFIPKGSKAPFGNCYFITQSDCLISAGETANILTVCDTLGAITVLTNEVQSFENSIANLDFVKNEESSVPGSAAESTNELRQRILLGDTIKYSLDGCKSALESLTGINYAKIYFNYNTKDSIKLVGDVELKARHAYIVVYGENENLAKTYAEYMSAPTQNAPNSQGTKSTVILECKASTVGNCTIPEGTTLTVNGFTFATDKTLELYRDEVGEVQATCLTIGENEVEAGEIENFDEEIENLEYVTNPKSAIPGTPKTAQVQDYVTESGQLFPIYYDKVLEKQVHIKVCLTEDSEINVQIENQIKVDLIQSSATWGIGQAVTSLLCGKPFLNCTYAKIAYILVSEDGEEWSNLIKTSCNVLPRLKDINIEVEQL